MGYHLCILVPAWLIWDTISAITIISASVFRNLFYAVGLFYPFGVFFFSLDAFKEELKGISRKYTGLP